MVQRHTTIQLGVFLEKLPSNLKKWKFGSVPSIYTEVLDLTYNLARRSWAFWFAKTFILNLKSLTSTLIIWLYLFKSNPTNTSSKVLKYRGPNLRVTWSENCSICVKNIWIFARFLKLLRSCWEKPRKNVEILRKIKKKLEANCTGFSAEFFGSQSVVFPGKCWQLLPGAWQVLFKSLRL